LEAEFGYESYEVDYADHQFDYYSDALLVRLAICIGLNRLISAIDAGYTTENYNNELKKKFMLSFSPKLNKYSKQPMLSLNINF